MEEDIFYNESNDEEVSQDETENCIESEKKSSTIDNTDEVDKFYDNLYEDSENNENEIELEDEVMILALKCNKTDSIFLKLMTFISPYYQK